ncbi:MAG: hypothetical protein QHJ73_18450, partial [Armatimonadota bacterium]|nr:hypothetical protein [Armatimonadota bacterium]
MRIGAVVWVLSVVATWGAGATGNPANLLADGDFGALRPNDRGRWEVRYARKMSDPASRPRWKAVLRVDEQNGAYGNHLSLEKEGAAAGTVYVGQRVRLPDPLPELEFSLDFQTFCEMAARSGSVALLVLEPEVWDRLSTDPEQAGQPADAFLFQAEVHRNRQDATAWMHAAVGAPALREALLPRAGQEVVAAVAWNTWHPSAVEWARFDNLWLGAPRPSVVAELWPRWAYRGEALSLRARVSNAQNPAVILRYRAKGRGAPWVELPMGAKERDRFEAVIPAAAVAAPLEVCGVLRLPGGAEVATAVQEIGMTQRPEHPNLYYNRDELARMRAKVDQFEWARTIFEGL